MKSFITTFQVKMDKDAEPIPVDARVEFSNHCFSESRKPDDTDNLVISKEQKRGGLIEERVFCPIRWEFSKRLPDIIKDLGHKSCLEGNSKEIFYRQEDPSRSGQHDGWYICMRMDFKMGKSPQLEIWVRSAHWRTNRPADIRGHGGTKFIVLLKKYLKGRL